MCLGIPGRVEAILPNKNQNSLGLEGTVNFSGVLRRVQLSFVPEVCIGDYVLVHVGVALSIIDEAAAKETLSLIDELDNMKAPDTKRD